MVHLAIIIGHFMIPTGHSSIIIVYSVITTDHSPIRMIDSAIILNRSAITTVHSVITMSDSAAIMGKHHCLPYYLRYYKFKKAGINLQGKNAFFIIILFSMSIWFTRIV